MSIGRLSVLVIVIILLVAIVVLSVHSYLNNNLYMQSVSESEGGVDTVDTSQYNVVIDRDVDVDIIFMYRDQSSILTVYEKDCRDALKNASHPKSIILPHISHIRGYWELSDAKKYDKVVIYVDINQYSIDHIYRLIDKVNSIYKAYMIIFIDIGVNRSTVNITRYIQIIHFLYEHNYLDKSAIKDYNVYIWEMKHDILEALEEPETCCGLVPRVCGLEFMIMKMEKFDYKVLVVPTNIPCYIYSSDINRKEETLEPIYNAMQLLSKSIIQSLFRKNT